MPEAFKFPDEEDTTSKTQSEQQSAAQDEIEIEIVDDTPERDRGRKPLDKEVADPTDDEIESYSEGVKKRIKELTHARHDERRAKEALLREKQELERIAQHMLEENQRLKKTVNTGHQAVASMAEQAAEAKLEKARRDLKTAQEAFDTDAIIAAQEALTEAKWEVQSAKNFRSAPLQEPEVPVQNTYAPPQRVQPDEKTLRWQAKNQWFGADGFEEVTSYALGLHQKLVSSGVDPRSDEYFDQIDDRIKGKFPEIFGEQSETGQATTAPAKKPAAVVAPATRSTGARRVQLTPTQAALVKKFNLDPKKYAEEVLKLEKQNG